MSLKCPICFLPYTKVGSDHAIYSLSCGHTMGCSCIEKMKENDEDGKLICPQCRKIIKDNDYHPLYGIPDELLLLNLDGLSGECLNEEDIIKQCSLGIMKKKVDFIKKFSKNINKFVNFFAAYNGFLILDVSTNEDEFEELKIFETKTGKEIYSQMFKHTFCGAMGVNTYRNDVINVCFGFEDGTLQIITTTLEGVKLNETIMNKDYQHIYSICFINENKFAYSVGNGNINTIDINKLFKKTIWNKSTKNKQDYYQRIYNLQKLRNDVLLGTKRNKLFVFKINEEPYELYNDKTEDFYYKVDTTTDMILITSTEEIYNDGKKLGFSFSYISKKITTVSEYDTLGRKKEIFCTCSITDTINRQWYRKEWEYEVYCRTPMINIKLNDRIKTYSFLPNFKFDKLDVAFLNSGFQFVDEGQFEKLMECLGIVCLNEPQQLLPKLFKVPIAVISIENFVVYDFFVQFFDENE